jgi:recombination protein RecR
MTTLPDAVTKLVSALNRLPGIGPRTAERLALHLVMTEAAQAKQLAETIVDARDKITTCEICGALTESQPCPICQSSTRDASCICVVERPLDIISLEKSGTFKGRYHVLGGKISPLNGVGPEDLRIESLESRLADGSAKEVILALGSDVEGDATGHYLAKRLASTGAKVTRIAQGLPAGSGLEFADELTLSRAMEGRRQFE